MDQRRLLMHHTQNGIQVTQYQRQLQFVLESMMQLQVNGEMLLVILQQLTLWHIYVIEMDKRAADYPQNLLFILFQSLEIHH